jgi:hypothetical protein
MRFSVYQGIVTVINLTYKNWVHAQVVGTKLKQRRMYNLTMSCGSVLLDTLRHFLNYKKIIAARMHARGNDDVDNKKSDEMTRKMGNRTNRATTHTYAPRLHPKLKSLQDLSIKFEAMVTKEVVVDADLCDDGGAQHRLSASLSLHRLLDLLDPLHQ